MAYIQRIAYRHLYSNRHQVIATLGMIFKSMRFFDFEKWLKESVPILDSAFRHCDFDYELFLQHGGNNAPMVQNYSMILNICLIAYERLSARNDKDMYDYLHDSMKSTSASDHSDEDYHGTELGGEWDVEGFVIRSGIVLTLGVLEEFERGVLRILFNHGTKPKVSDSSCKLIYPRLKHYRANSVEWEKAEKSRKSHSVSGRHMLLRSFSVDADPQTEWNKRLKDMRTDRNTIAHGVATLSQPFQAYLQLHYDIYRAIKHIAMEVLSKQRIAL